MTLRQIQSELALWCSDEPQPRLLEHLTQMIDVLRRNADELGDPGSYDEEFGKLLQGTRKAYADLIDSLQELTGLVQAGDKDSAREEAAYLKAGTASLRQYTEAIEQWLQEPSLRCPRCGSGSDGSADEVCGKCGLERLIPDSQPNSEAGFKFQTMSQDYVQVFKTYLAVVGGEAPLCDLEEPLRLLESQFENYLEHFPNVNDPQLQPLVRKLRAGCQESLKGVSQMWRAFESREVADLNGGWLRVFKTSEALKQDLAELVDALSRYGGYGQRSQATFSQDVIQISE